MDFSNVKDWTIPEGDAEIVFDSNDNIIWEKPNRDYSKEYLFIENKSPETANVSIKKQMPSAPAIEVFYSLNRRTWVSMGTTSTTAIGAVIPSNSRMYLKATANAWGTSLLNYNNITVSKTCRIGGNIQSILHSDNYRNYTNLTANYTFVGLFGTNSNLVDAKDLILPTNNVTDYCYDYMFSDCSSLTEAPVLPVKSMRQGCYSGMFRGCSKLVNAPELPATTLAESCYEAMFENCTSITTAPVLRGVTKAFCFSKMFKGCSKLVNAPALNSNYAVNSCYNGMFWGCTSLTTAPALPAQSVAQGAYGSMFRNCTSLVTAPALPATTLNYYCYNCMFYGCTNLVNAPALPATSIREGCYQSMFKNCTSITTAPVISAPRFSLTCCTEMFSGCTSLTSMTTYVNDISANRCTENWLSGVSTTGDFYNLGGATYPTGASGIPDGWTEHTSL